MIIELIVLLVLLALAGRWLHRRRKAAAAAATGDDQDSVRHDHAQAYERAKAEADLQRWSGTQ